MTSDVSKSVPRYELHHDQLLGAYTIRKVQDIGPFLTREAARRYMIDSTEERFAENDALAERYV